MVFCEGVALFVESHGSPLGLGVPGIALVYWNLDVGLEAVMHRSDGDDDRWREARNKGAPP